MVYQLISINDVIGRVVRNTRLQDASYVQDMFEWIPEAMSMLETKTTLTYKYKDIEISFHKGKLPCDLVRLPAVEYEGRRLSYSSTAKNYLTGHVISTPSGSTSTEQVFTSVIATNPNDTYFDQNNIIWTSTLESATANLNSIASCDQHPTDWYSIEPGWLTTSIPDGTIRLHYMAIPVDDSGLPLVPDNNNYKEALYLYVRAKMIGAGFVDPIFREQELMERFEMMARRAINEITYPTPDEKEQQVKTQMRLIPPANY